MSADETTSVSRRGFLRAATGAAAATAAAGTAASQEGNSTSTSSGNESSGNQTGTPSGNESSGNQTGTSSGNESAGGGGGGGGTEEVVVGPDNNPVFEPSDLEIKPGTTVNFVWESDNHNIVVDSKPDGSNWEGTEGGEGQTYNTGHEYSYTFETEGDFAYYCAPHQGTGMEASITVSQDAGSGGGGQQVPTVPESAKTLGIASTIGMASTLGLAYFLMRYGGDYEQP